MCKGADPTDFFFLAMAQRQRGNRAEAERSFERGVDLAKKYAASFWE